MSRPSAPSASTPRPAPLDHALLLLLAFIWGSSFTIIKIVVPHLPPFNLTLWRVGLATLALAAVAAWLGERWRFSAPAWGWILLAGLTGNVLPFTLISWGEERMDSGLAAILISITPLLVLVLAHLLTGEERLTPRRLLGVVLGMGGIVALVGGDALRGLGEDIFRQLAVALAAACYAVNTLIVRHLQLRHLKRRGERTGAVALAAAIMAVSTVSLAPLVPVLEGIVIPPPSAAMWAATLGVVHTALATLVMFAIIARAGAGFFAMINFLIPLIGYLLGIALLGETPSPRALLALALVLGGIYLATTRIHARGT